MSMNLAAADPWIPQPWRICEVRRDTADVFSWELEPLQGQRADFLPGQFNMLYHFGHGEVAVSISGATAQGRLVHTIRAVGAVTRQLQALQSGATIGLRGPFGRGWPLAELRGHDVVIVAGGLGIAPLKPLVEWLLAHRSDYGRLYILYGARRPEDLLYANERQVWQGHPDVVVRVTVDNGGGNWRGEVGAVTHLLDSCELDPARTLAVVCGPEVMMRFTVLSLQQAGLPAQAIYLSMERHMQCAVGYCGHCFYGPQFVCRDGPVFRFDRLHGGLAVSEL